MIQEALYSFICQSYAVCNPEFKAIFPLDNKSTIVNLNVLMHSIKTGSHYIVENPEQIATHDILDKKRHAIKYRGPVVFPFETLCLWFTPRIFNVSNPSSEIKEKHLICVNRINSKALHFIYAVADFEDKGINHYDGEIDFSWSIVPYTLLFSLPPYQLYESPLLPLPPVLSNNIRLKNEIVSIKTGKKDDTSMAFISMEKNNAQEMFSDAVQYLFPGIFEFFLGFLEKYDKGLLNSEMGEEEEFFIKGEEAWSPDEMLSSKITYQRITLNSKKKTKKKK